MHIKVPLHLAESYNALYLCATKSNYYGYSSKYDGGPCPPVESPKTFFHTG